MKLNNKTLSIVILGICVSLSAGSAKTQRQSNQSKQNGWDIRSSMDVAITENSTLGLGYTWISRPTSSLRLALEQTPYIDKDDGSSTVTNKTGLSLEYGQSGQKTKRGFGITYLRDNGEKSGTDYTGSYAIRAQSFIDRYITNRAYIGLGVGAIRQRQAPNDGSAITNKTVYGGLTLRAGLTLS